MLKSDLKCLSSSNDEYFYRSMVSTTGDYDFYVVFGTSNTTIFKIFLHLRCPTFHPRRDFSDYIFQILNAILQMVRIIPMVR